MLVLDDAEKDKNTADSYSILNKNYYRLYLNRTMLLKAAVDREEKLKQAGIKAKESPEKMLSKLINE